MISLSKLYRLFKAHPKVFTDSRSVIPDGIFFALKGDRFNGNAYAQQAIKSGAAYAVIDEADKQLDDRYLLVDDVLKTLQELGNHHRKQFDIPVLGITGSNGKTTTKELVAKVLGEKYRIHWTQGNLNNHIGLPLTLLAMPEDTELAIIEMGANHQGEIDLLSTIAAPTHGLITNIGKAHLEGFGGIEGVKKGKSELYRYLARTGGVLFVNQDERFLTELAPTESEKVFYHSSEPLSGPYQAFVSHGRPFLHVHFLDETGKELVAETHLSGAYNFGNVLTAIAVGQYFELPGTAIKKALESYIPANKRSQLMQLGQTTIWMDAYNANPTSMKHSFEHFAKMPGERKIAVLGDMLELGDDSRQEHDEILRWANSLGVKTVVTLGPEFARSAEQEGNRSFQTVEELASWLKQQDLKSTLLFLKASRGIRLDKVLDLLSLE